MEEQLTNFAQTLFDAAQAKNWQAVAALALIFVVYLLRKFSGKIGGKFGAWLNSDRGGSVLVMVASFGGAMATALLAKHKISLNLVVASLIVATSASGARNMAWDLLSPKDKPKKEKKPKQPKPGTVVDGEKPKEEPKSEEKPPEEKPPEEPKP
jgi:outer membrane biosynthesis protein TonB